MFLVWCVLRDCSGELLVVYSSCRDGKSKRVALSSYRVKLSVHFAVRVQITGFTAEPGDTLKNEKKRLFVLIIAQWFEWYFFGAGHLRTERDGDNI